MQEDDSVKMQELDDFNQAVEDKHSEILDAMLSGNIYWFNGEPYSIDDFTCNMEIDSELFRGWIEDGSKGFEEASRGKLIEWCEKLATKVIKGEV